MGWIELFPALLHRFGRRNCLFEAKQGIFQTKLQSLAFMNFAFADSLQFMGKLQDKRVRFVKFTSNLGDFLLVLLDIAKQE